MAPRVLHLSTYDANGGAGRAAYALHRAMVDHGIPSRMHVARKATNDPTVTEGDRRRFHLASEADRALWKLQRSPNTTWRSPARFGSLTADHINRSSADIVNLHWVTDGFLSIETIGKIEKPIVWSMYDMWPFSGTEHYGADTRDARWRTGYSATNRSAGESGLDLDRWTFERKQRLWPHPGNTIRIVPASTWLEAAVKRSALMDSWPITRIPHVVDPDRFAPRSKQDSRLSLGLDPHVSTLLFLASAGISDERKGFDLLERALPRVKEAHPNVHLVIVGPRSPQDQPQTNVPITWAGESRTDEHLALLYAAADVAVVPSREDNMPLTAMEAQTAGRPVVAFNIGGLPDIVEDGRTGALAQPEETESLARAIIRTLGPETNEAMAKAARDRALTSWSPKVIVSQYADLYEQALS